MAKEFKEFDKRYASLAGTALKTIATIGGPIPKEDIWKCDHWPYLVHFTEDYTQGAIAYAVYQSPDALEWQKFRVSLKGLSTYEKLYALGWYWDWNIAPVYDITERQRFVTRINNYLSALKRGGLLNERLEVIR